MSTLISDGMGGLITTSSGSSPPTTPQLLVIDSWSTIVKKESKLILTPSVDGERVPFNSALSIDYATSAYVEVI